MTSTHSKKLSCPLGANPGNAATGHTDRGVVPGRDAGGAEEQADLSLGQERFTPTGRPRPAYPIDLSVRRGLSRARHRLRPGAAGLQPTGHAVSSRRDCTPGRAGGTRHSPSRPRTSGSSCGKTGSLTASSHPTTTSSTTAATPGTLSSISPGKSCPSHGATGHTNVSHPEDWYYTTAAGSRCATSRQLGTAD